MSGGERERERVGERGEGERERERMSDLVRDSIQLFRRLAYQASNKPLVLCLFFDMRLKSEWQ